MKNKNIVRAQKNIKKFFKNFQKSFGKRKSEHNISMLLMIVTILLVFISVRLVGFARTDKDLKQQQRDMIAQLDTFADIQDLLGQQIQAITSLSQSELESLRQQTDDRIADARNALEDARINLEDKIELQGSAIRTVINRWRVRVPQIKCNFASVDDGVVRVSTTRGSGTFFKKDGETIMLSNQHVFEEKNKTLQDCDVTFPREELTYTFTAENLTLDTDPDTDLGTIVVTEPPKYTVSRFADASEMCQSKAAIGDSIVILGYPSIGSDNDITATEGIISGYEGNFYITSAKVERGNSGGAAIWVEQNCYLGIPTFTTAGQAESLARILDINTI